MIRAFVLYAILVSLQLLVYLSFIKFLKTAKFYKPNQRFIALIPFVIFNVPFGIISFITKGNFDLPHWIRQSIIEPFYIWQGATLLIALWLLVGLILKLPFKIPIWILKIFKPIRNSIKNFKKKKPVQVVDLGRRKFVRYTTMAVSAYAFGGAAIGAIKHSSYEIDYRKIKIENLPDEFKNFTISLISDIHAGQYMDETEMKEYADVVNSLRSDIICIPGDFVNSDSNDSHHVASAFRDLKAKFGVYGSLGNHDLFGNGEDYITEVMNNESPVKMMRNRHYTVNINGKELYILGVDDTRNYGAVISGLVMNWLDAMVEHLSQTFPNYDSSPKILLCHKPYGFEHVAMRNIDLTLSGHTHGGQIVPVKFGKFNLSPAGLLSNYVEGLYQIGKANMYVSRGIGTVLFPIRINCPPEITKITLV